MRCAVSICTDFGSTTIHFINRGVPEIINLNSSPIKLNVMHPIYDVDYFIGKLSAIPESLWYEGSYTHPNIDDSHCVLGHCGERYQNDSITTDRIHRTNESSILRSLVAEYIRCDIVEINDMVNHPKYHQRTPKQRILAALYDIKRAQDPQFNIPPVTIDQLIGEDVLTIQ
jgi:hypothetical protein